MRSFTAPLVLALLTAACSSGPAAKSPPVAPPASGAATPTLAASTPAATPQPFLGITLTDVRTGERFTLGGSVGKVVIVEGMAVW